MKDLFVRRIYTKYGISVVVELDFVKKTVSLVEKDGSKKNWSFNARTPEYLNGWRAILKAMEYAVSEAQKELLMVTEQENSEFIKLYATIDQNLKNVKAPVDEN